LERSREGQKKKSTVTSGMERNGQRPVKCERNAGDSHGGKGEGDGPSRICPQGGIEIQEAFKKGADQPKTGQKSAGRKGVKICGSLKKRIAKPQKKGKASFLKKEKEVSMKRWGGKKWEFTRQTKNASRKKRNAPILGKNSLLGRIGGGIVKGSIRKENLLWPTRREEREGRPQDAAKARAPRKHWDPLKKSLMGHRRVWEQIGT